MEGEKIRLTPEEKFVKIKDSCDRALENLRQGNKFGAVGDIHFIKENAEEALLLLTESIREDQE